MYSFDYDYTTSGTLTVSHGDKVIMVFEGDDAHELYDELVQCSPDEQQDILSGYDYEIVC